ncbi:ATP-dependent helicase HrpA [Ruaniaceae bacterium KH17]|nr:ATP-dependent helicase HrpA [Ruaniaceae bacterium KH17]
MADSQHSEAPRHRNGGRRGGLSAAGQQRANGTGGQRGSRDRRRPARTPRRLTPEQIQARAAAVPEITYPAELPVAARRDEIARAIAENQVVIVAGETGSGKTTQIPKICLELGRGVNGMIGHTQPRRLAARTVAERIAEELKVPLGGAVGYQVRFTDEVSATTLVKLMTDGILLAEIQRDPMLTRYDTIIVDEAHERSLNIDFLLGYLSNLLPRRPDLKVIITSATIDSERFAKHFGPRMAAPLPQAPIVEVTGRTYPVEVRYRSLVSDAEDDAVGREGIDQFTAICLAADELMHEGPGDILVFLSGEREIRDATEALTEHLAERVVTPPIRNPRPNAVELVPLYARLSSADQHRVFERHSTRRIVLATNVAETSLTVPGIRYVIDPGTARISRYSTRTKVQRLPIEPISQASANQRSGRCGRVADGIAIRLYSEEDFNGRPEFTEPEILRTSLASVILQMTSIGLGDVASFPFVDPPDGSAIRDGVLQLREIGALADGDERGSALRLTPTGRRLAQLPIDPRLGRMLLEAQQNGCASEMLVVVAAMSVQDVRERPAEKQAQADQLHARFTDGTSDFVSYLTMWRYLRAAQRDLSHSAFRRKCRAEYIHYLRVREWQDVVAQLRQVAKQVGIALRPISLPPPGSDPLEAPSGGVDSDSLHRSLLVGLLSNIGAWDETRRDYAGARGTRFVVWPGSGLAKKKHAWVMAAELVETSRLFARTVAKINPDWIEAAAAHVVKKVHSEPFWSAKRGAAMVHEKVLLYGIPVVADRVIPLASLGTDSARAYARELFVRQALVAGEWRTHHTFWAENQRLLEEAREVEERSRQRGLVADEQAIEAFYEARVPAEVTSTRHFDTWWKTARRADPQLLTFTRELLLPDADQASGEYPETWVQGDLELALDYTFSPGERGDGVTVKIPLSVLPRVRDEGFDWLVPGMLPELAVATIRALPKRTRVQLVPAPDTATAALAAMGRGASASRRADLSSLARRSGGADSPGSSSVHVPAALEARADGEPMASGSLRAQSGRLPEASALQRTWAEGHASGVPFAAAFAAALREVKDVAVPLDEFDPAALPEHLRITFAVLDERGAVLGAGPHLLTLQRRFAEQARAAIRTSVKGAVGRALEEAGIAPSRRSALSESNTPRHSARSEAKSQNPGGASSEGSLYPATSRRMTNAAGLTEIDSLSTWPETLPTIPRSIEQQVPGGLTVRAYPALTLEKPTGGKTVTDQLHTVAVRIFGFEPEQHSAHPDGVLTLALREVALAEQRVTTRWSTQESLILAASPYRTTAALVADIELAAARALAPQWPGPSDSRHSARSEVKSQSPGSAPEPSEVSLDPATTRRIKSSGGAGRTDGGSAGLSAVWSEDAYRELVAFLRERLEDQILTTSQSTAKILTAWRDTEKAIKGATSLALLDVVTDVKAHVASLVSPGFIGRTPPDRLIHLPRYLTADRLRLERAVTKPDAPVAWQIRAITQEVEDAVGLYEAGPPDPARAARLAEARWLIEELRVSLFAQQLGTPVKVSDKRIRKLLDS